MFFPHCILVSLQHYINQTWQVCLACLVPKSLFWRDFFWIRKSLVTTLSVLTTNRDLPLRSQVVYYCCHRLLLDHAFRSLGAFSSHMLLGYLIILAYCLWHSLTHPCALQMAYCDLAAHSIQKENMNSFQLHPFYTFFSNESYPFYIFIK